MKSPIFVAAVLLMISGSTKALVVDDLLELDDITVNVAHEIPLKIYLPPDHDPQSDPYRVYIYLHGCCSDNYASHVSTMSAVLDELIVSEDIAPIVVVWPNVYWPGAPNPDGDPENFNNFHEYTDSSRNGDYDSIISIDLLAWLKSPEQHAMQYNLSADPDDYAIGGFSMGAGGAIRMGARHHEQFAAVVAQSGIIAWQVIANNLSLLLGEYPEGPPYDWDPSRGWFSNEWFAWSSDFSPNPTGNMPAWGIDFPVDPETGDWIPEIIYDIWIDENDSIELYRPLKTPGSVPGEYVLPIAIYFDVRDGDINQLFGDQFNGELHAEGVVGYEYNVWSGGSHQLMADAVEASLLHINEAMDLLDMMSPVETPGENSQPAIPQHVHLKPNFPNPFNPHTTLKFAASQNVQAVVSIYDVTGHCVTVLAAREFPAGDHVLAWNGKDTQGRDVPSGSYIVRLETDSTVESRKISLIR